MLEATIVKYKENGQVYYGYYFQGIFVSAGFKFLEDVQEYLWSIEVDTDINIREIDFDNHMQQSREWNKLAHEHFGFDDKLDYVEIMIRKLMILRRLTYGIPKEDTYRSAILMPIDELDEEVNYWKTLYKLTEVGGI
jgi:hypothetical protein